MEVPPCIGWTGCMAPMPVTEAQTRARDTTASSASQKLYVTFILTHLKNKSNTSDSVIFVDNYFPQENSN